MRNFAAIAMGILMGLTSSGCDWKKDKSTNNPTFVEDTAPSIPPQVPAGSSDDDPTTADSVPPQVPAGSSDSVVNDDPLKPFSERLIGSWLGCQQGPTSSRSFQFTFGGERSELITADFTTTNCQPGAPADLPPETWELDFKLGEKQGSYEIYDFEYRFFDGAGIPSGTVYTSVKIEGNQLLMSRGANDLNIMFGNGKSPETRYKFPDNPTSARNRVLTKIKY